MFPSLHLHIDHNQTIPVKRLQATGVRATGFQSEPETQSARSTARATKKDNRCEATKTDSARERPRKMASVGAQPRRVSHVLSLLVSAHRIARIRSRRLCLMIVSHTLEFTTMLTLARDRVTLPTVPDPAFTLFCTFDMVRQD